MCSAGVYPFVLQGLAVAAVQSLNHRPGPHRPAARRKQCQSIHLSDVPRRQPQTPAPGQHRHRRRIGARRCRRAGQWGSADQHRRVRGRTCFFFLFPFLGTSAHGMVSAAVAVAGPDCFLASAYTEVVGPSMDIVWSFLPTTPPQEMDDLVYVMQRIFTAMGRISPPPDCGTEDFVRASVPGFFYVRGTDDRNQHRLFASHGGGQPGVFGAVEAVHRRPLPAVPGRL